jgi:hypothetical protein
LRTKEGILEARNVHLRGTQRPSQLLIIRANGLPRQHVAFKPSCANWFVMMSTKLDDFWKNLFLPPLNCPQLWAKKAVFVSSVRPRTLVASSVRPHTLVASSLRPHTLVK